MLRVTVEIVPNGDEHRKTEIGRMVVTNTADHEAAPLMGNYVAQVLTTAPNGDIHASTRRILDFDRIHGNVWRLIHTVLEALGERGMEGESNEGQLPR